MSIFGDILHGLGGAGAAVLSGGVTGILGQVLGRVIGVWEAREKRKDQVLAYAQQEKEWLHEGELIKLQMQQSQEANEQAADLADRKGGWDALTASYTAEANVRESYRWVEAVRSLARPFLTLECQIGLAVVFLCVKASRPDLVAQITDTIVFMASASLLWWFGERATNRMGK